MNLLAVFTDLIATNPREGGGFTVRQLAVLGSVVEHPAGEWGVRELASKLKLSKPAVTRALDVLVAEELVTRAPVPLDRRLIRVTATAAGRRLWANAMKAGTRAAADVERAA